MSEKPMFVGIDPGKSGAIAVIDEDGKVVTVDALKDDTDRDVLDVLREFAPHVELACLEEVHAMPVNGSVGGFKLGSSYGALRMALVAAGVKFDRVPPQTWQKHMRCMTGGDKNITKARAQELFPGLKITHAIADALILAEFARRKCRFTGGDAIAQQ